MFQAEGTVHAKALGWKMEFDLFEELRGGWMGWGAGLRGSQLYP